MLKNSLSIPEFCYAENISRSLFYKLKKEGNAPRLMRVGRRILISIEAAKDWRKQMEECLNGETNGK
ncbi:MAG: hypothetical protein KIT56_03485 [Gammaproteobacteria bacterium]|nr:hypothetical protein [Gammaproteobacteria bacterium]MCW5582940.1 hypothetical protein [Gammaproteobacteria bacterium]